MKADIGLIGLAVMGFAASGVILSYKPYGTSLITLCLAYSVTIFLAYAVINFITFDSYSIAWDRRQVGVLSFTSCRPLRRFCSQGG